MDAQGALIRMGGVARRFDLVEAVGRAEFDRAVANNQIRRVRRGIYEARVADQAMDAARRAGGVLSHLSAAHRWNFGLTVYREQHDVTVPRRSNRAAIPRDVTLHYADLPAEDIVDGCTTKLRTVIDCLRHSPEHLALAALEHAVGSRHVELSDVRDRVGGLRGPGSARARRILGWYDPRASPPLESALRGILLNAGIDRFRPQFVVWDGTRKVATTDLGDPETRVLLEADSFLNHGSRDQLARDAARYNELVALGFHVLRFTYRPIVAGSPWVLRIVRRTLATHDRS